MTNVDRSWLIATVLMALGACAPDSPEERPTDAERRQGLHDSAFGGLVEPMDRAAEVERLQLERKRELDAAIDQ